MQRSTLKKVGKRVLQVVLLVLIIYMLVEYVIHNWHTLSAYKFQLNPWLVALSFVGFFLQELSYGIIWRSVLARLGSRLDLRASLRIYLGSEFVRYIPGNVWHVLTRILWVGKYGVSRPVAFASMTIELITKLAAGALMFALSLLFWSDIGAVRSLLNVNGTPLLIGLGVLLTIALLVVLHPRVLNGLLNTALRILKRTPITLSLRYSDILLVTLAWCGSWFIAGCAFYVLLLALFPGLSIAVLPICIGIYAIAWDIGFVSFITPSGLGFREGAIGLLFALSLPMVPQAVAVIIAALSRLVSTLAELVCVSIAYVSGGTQMREVQREQTVHSEQAPLPEGDSDQGEETSISMTDVSTQMPVEGGVGSD